ncbi:hypothetical protein ALC62_03530 [Cyphomyrmex costatus]|uniref:Uncharacterized protein n=1 Tax=Cyphomyrmex costatus TaxID=456900 RepID=A0A151ILD3_9HYME|nr:hypothetical protein ALC62_03530 [Cyphomyrmex costatus]
MQAMIQNVYTYMASTVLSRPSGFNVKIDPRKLLLYMFANCLTSLVFSIRWETASDKYPRLAMEILGNALPIEMPSNASIHRAQGIVEQIDIRLSINRPREVDSRSLPTGQRYASISDQCHVSLWKLSEILLFIITIALDHENYLHVSSLVIGLTKQYVVPHSTNKKPGFLTGIGNTQIWIVRDISSGQIARKIILRALSKDYGTRAEIQLL